MSLLLHWFTSPEWAQVVKALLHSLWQGALTALVLAIVLRRLSNPVARYRFSLVALAAVVFAAIVTWSMLNAASHPAPKPPLVAPRLTPVPAILPDLDSSPDVIVLLRHKTTDIRWTAWLALAWLAGAMLMMTRAGIKVGRAEQLRRSCRPLDNAQIETLLAETRRALGLARRIRVGVTDKLTSPAVVGIVVPMLILPLALLTTLTPEQIRFVLLHELAHIRRRDYLANLFQFFAESLLFFNPAIWWISHQIRREREACCDALATALSGAPADYAQTLVRVAEQILCPSPVAAPAFGNKREPSTLAERIQRLLVPGYRPSLQLTWRAMLAALIVGGVLLFSSAVGTRLTMAAVLTIPSGTNGVASSPPPPPGTVVAENEPTNIVRTNPMRQKIYRKLTTITLDKASYPGMPLSEVTRSLLLEVQRHDPDHEQFVFVLRSVSATNDAPTNWINLKDVRINLNEELRNARLVDVLSAIVKSADHPIKYTVLDDGIEFSFHSGFELPELFTRTFKFDRNTVLTRLGCQLPVDISETNVQAVQTDFIKAFTNAGFNLLPPRSIFFNYKQGTLTCHSTADDLDAIEKWLDRLNDTHADHSLPSNSTSNQVTHASGQNASRDDVAKAVQDGKLLFQVGKMDEAEKKFQEVLQSDPDNQAAVYYLTLIKQNRVTQNRVKNAAIQRGSGNLPNATLPSGLHTRTFKVDTNAFYSGLKSYGELKKDGSIKSHVPASDQTSQIQAAIINLFSAAGVNLSYPKTVFYNDRQGTLTVHATTDDLDMIEAAVDAMNVKPPKVTIKARFVEVDLSKFLNGVLTNNLNSTGPNGVIMRVLSGPQMQEVMNVLDQNRGVKVLNENEVTTLSGLHAMWEMVDVNTIVDGLKTTVTNGSTARTYQTTNMNFGAVLNVVPSVNPDGKSISMKLTPSLTEFLGYEKPSKFIKTHPLTKEEQKEYKEDQKPPVGAQWPIPKIRTRTATAETIVTDGDTVVLGNLSDDVTTTIPDGKEFKEKYSSKSYKQLLVFVTATIDHGSDPADARINARDYFDGPVQ